jgi:Methyltransferase FkbM domain
LLRLGDAACSASARYDRRVLRARGHKTNRWLKSDTQGFELDALRGDSRMFGRRRIGLVYIEVIFSAMYQGLPRTDETPKFLFNHGFRIVSFYVMHYQNDLLGWTDILFVNPAYSDGATHHDG